jgi:NAD(P)-dependent dehydrogenase (short-subunit alcohol dehydrogenase family)
MEKTHVMRLRGKVAIVTGSSRGIGRGIVKRLASEGAKVVINGRHPEALEQVALELRASGAEVLTVSGDVGYREDVDRLFDETVRTFGGVNILVNNVGWTTPKVHFLETSEELWDTMLRTNLKSVYLCCHRAANLMVDQRCPGSLINVSSFSAARAHRLQSSYDATKGGIDAFTRAVAIELAPFSIRVNVVGPGAIHTEAQASLGPEVMARRTESIPLGRIGYPADIGAAVAFLASEDSSYITGQSLYVDGGVLAQLRSPQTDHPLPSSVAARLWKLRS